MWTGEQQDRRLKHKAYSNLNYELKLMFKTKRESQVEIYFPSCIVQCWANYKWHIKLRAILFAFIIIFIYDIECTSKRNTHE